MDNCGCAPGSPFASEGFLGNNSMNNMNAPMNNSMNNMNAPMNNQVNANMMSNGNNSNAVLNNVGNSVQQLPNTNLQSNNVAASEILKAIAKNNAQQLNAEAEAENQQVNNNQPPQINVNPVQPPPQPQSTTNRMGQAALLTLAVLVALAWNDTIKYYIGRMIKLNRGSPYLYLYYALIVTLVAVLAQNLVRNV
tara:strand:+ start:1146 stop:1727 length:582 start_codon:yes stop_codon:yes gene_type:complete